MLVPVPAVTKRCPRCDELGRPADHPREDFAPHPRSRDGLQGWCRACQIEHGHVASPAAGPDAGLQRKRGRRGAVPERHAVPHADQGGRCAFCQKSECMTDTDGTVRRLTEFYYRGHGGARFIGLVCYLCEQGVVALRHDPAVMLRIAALLLGPTVPTTQARVHADD